MVFVKPLTPISSFATLLCFAHQCLHGRQCIQLLPAAAARGLRGEVSRRPRAEASGGHAERPRGRPAAAAQGGFEKRTATRRRRSGWRCRGGEAA
ncbi:hypothetical protein BS78_05G255400 [Paspalum vaginatum]|nr:hypothetical protein BS78_05G255400 [Paspalum vaginatum]